MRVMNLSRRSRKYDKYQMYVNRFVMLGQELGAERITMHSWFDPRTFTTTMRAACEVDGAVYTGSYGYTDGELVDAHEPELFVATCIMAALRKAYQASGIWYQTAVEGLPGLRWPGPESVGGR